MNVETKNIRQYVSSKIGGSVINKGINNVKQTVKTEKNNGRSQGKMLKDVLNELTQKYSLSYMAQPRPDAIYTPKACYMPLLCIAIDLHTHYFCFREVLRDRLQQPQTPKYFLEFMFAIVPSKMVQK